MKINPRVPAENRANPLHLRPWAASLATVLLVAVWLGVIL